MSLRKLSDSPEGSVAERTPLKEATKQVARDPGVSIETKDDPAQEPTRDPFFEVSLSGLKLTSQEDPAPIQPATYITACASVDNSQRDYPRGSTQAHRGAGRRFPKHMFSPQAIAGALRRHCDKGRLINLVPEDEERRTGDVLYQVDPERTKDLVAVSHQFIGLQKTIDEHGKPEYRLNDQPAHLASVLKNCQPWLFEISAEQTQVDLLQTFFHLMRCQDFSKFGGVDPRLASAAFKECHPEDNPAGGESCRPIEDNVNLIARFMVAPSTILTKDGIGQEILGNIATKTGPRTTVQTRLDHAIRQLIRAKLLYRVAVLWDGDPREDAAATPVVTVAVRGSSIARLERCAQQDVDQYLDRTGTWPKNEQFKLVDFDAEDGRTEHVCKDTGIYRYVVPSEKLQSWVLLDQYRVRWWGMTDENLARLSHDAARVKNYITALYQLIGHEEVW